jgi:hypothetical protein
MSAPDVKVALSEAEAVALRALLRCAWSVYPMALEEPEVVAMLAAVRATERAKVLADIEGFANELWTGDRPAGDSKEIAYFYAANRLRSRIAALRGTQG